MFAGSLSLTFHGGLAIVAIVLAGLRAAHPPAIEPTPIDIIPLDTPAVVSPPAPSGPGTIAGNGHTALAGTRGRRGQDLPKRSQTKAPPVNDPYAEVVMGYDAPDSAHPGNPNGTTGSGLGTGLFGNGTGNGTGFGLGGDGPGIPAPPISHARPPRPKHDYLHQELLTSRKFGGTTVVLKLVIDAKGKVEDVSVLTSVDPAIDHEAITMARDFEFYPALRDDGEPRAGTFRWDFLIFDQPDPSVTQGDVPAFGNSLRTDSIFHRDRRPDVPAVQTLPKQRTNDLPGAIEVRQDSH
ncbi:MAG TPA: energy transducer TonB [Kofleriaceae bacterium]|jgi:TonB family protein|nr:energy transducer TonB [Kofleriaceae bacterium]